MSDDWHDILVSVTNVGYYSNILKSFNLVIFTLLQWLKFKYLKISLIFNYKIQLEEGKL